MFCHVSGMQRYFISRKSSFCARLLYKLGVISVQLFFFMQYTIYFLVVIILFALLTMARVASMLQLHFQL